MSLLKMAGEIFMSQLGGQAEGLNLDAVMKGLQQLLPTEGGDIDIAALVAKFTGSGGGLAAMASSWLGDGGNQSFSASDLLGLLGQDKVSQFADQVGVDTDTAASGLSDMIPQLIDKSSSGGDLLAGMTGDGAASLLNKFF
ncbi:YidB family protein [Gilvimarinus xylanilyticus]|uniref:YidB family protein n=1 Tax=Gilvimarinus xylanilyticus TaxID=2944139 RepID=A0A9X2HXA4_9GAMM|nr:YidB family protein [Gilvimarinus xylanilyticus]MCP8900108.1 YidB family protein [Gilvimarinus xylanilyticus]